jgi:phage terminase large subunit
MAVRTKEAIVRAQFPRKLRFLFEVKRYKVAYGGRGSAKSWSFARALLLLGSESPLRILCAREIQKSIKQSVHTLLSDQIKALGLGAFYEILDNEIRGENGTLFVFSGLSTHTVESIKSYEAIDIVWVEEAQTVSKRSWTILIPTIRKDGSEIWISFNPEMDTDETYVRFVEDPPEESIVEKVNYTDNPWFPEVLEKERLEAKRKLPKDEYENIWEGACKATVDGAIYANEVRDAQEAGRIRLFPYEPRLKVHVVCDLGWNDSMFIALVQRDMSSLRVIKTIQDDHRTLDSYSAELKDLRLNWGKLWLPDADGDTGNIQSGGLSAKSIFKKLGWEAELVPDIGVEEGIRIARMTFPRVYFHKPDTLPLINALKRYRRHINKTTNEPSAPLHDQWSHGADCYRYICIAADRMENEARKKPPPTNSFQPLDRSVGY